MPVFDYQCTECGKRYEQLHKGPENSDAVVCPECGSKEHKRLISAPAISMNGFSGNSSNFPSAGGSCASGLCGLN